ncbi:helix-turn-helix transcriptional regulator [Lactobacillus gasseri]|uniref:DNA-binding helix-turn-helix protein n=2 Tax=Lactobacillus gasseri TaxID=1596 RepID=D1YJ41_LACGS|nr:helix-turn-helix transcriptional regulator [Lactobacillus gasseri]EFB62562.1 DNA-binding helix-turn-helix protein [Lactobacillus gasseri 224-1]KFL96325.1 toxin-antitoxin system, antitoxin component, Xre family [Lactobacillus gasseri SV-16A-US]MCZ3850768.1 helix-turn-helix domain-containing protein [Lactobacillus gasseri]MCZ3852520.1 helix-turn-helix domain-containing protein [Lactobacillus gasseri]MCZ3861235.1 helix-turn-helix domain-containing protein [Lactobacillus gasseri]
MNRIKQLREEKGVSQSDVANAVGITRQAVSLYEQGKRAPKLEIWQKLADLFEVSVPYLQGLSEMSEQVYLIQSTDCLVDRAIQNAIVIAESKSDALAKFKKELKENSECTQEYKPEWFTCQKLDLSSSKIWLQYGGDTWRFNEVEYLDLEEGK